MQNDCQSAASTGGVTAPMPQHDAKQDIRERVWDLLEAQRAAPPGVHGTTPDFHGAGATAARLAEVPEWQQAKVIKANPDHAQLPVRVRALQDGKLLYMAVPRMASQRPFYLLEPTHLPDAPEVAASKAGAERNGHQVGVDEMQPIDLVICGSVAVNRSGVRIGKGAGYSDLEVALLVEAGLVTEQTVIVAPVHPLQVIDDDIPETEHDFSVDLIVTPDETIRRPRTPRPSGLVWQHLPPEKIADIPVLSTRAEARHRDRTAQ
jgi:5-formyltetrahydrofolate cyclo-ligase